jgi:hypothetical protein
MSTRSVSLLCSQKSIPTTAKAEQTSDHVHLVGLSATLPNYQDVTTFCAWTNLKDTSISMHHTVLVHSSSNSLVSQ